MASHTVPTHDDKSPLEEKEEGFTIECKPSQQLQQDKESVFTVECKPRAQHQPQPKYNEPPISESMPSGWDAAYDLHSPDCEGCSIRFGWNKGGYTAQELAWLKPSTDWSVLESMLGPALFALLSVEEPAPEKPKVREVRRIAEYDRSIAQKLSQAAKASTTCEVLQVEETTFPKLPKFSPLV